MTSPVDTSVKNFNSTMANAPVFNTVAGALAALLDACLVTGFDTRALTSLVALGGVMTATFAAAHSSQPDSVVVVAGVTGGPTGFAGANGEQKVVSAPSSLTRTWATTLPDGTYTGSISIKMAPLGFTSPFTGTNLRTYKSGDVTSAGMILRLDDTGTTIARVRGYESMSDINTGTGPFPTDAQISGGGYWAKGLTASATALPWVVVGDSKAFYIFIAVNNVASAAFTQGWTRGFGDMIALRPGGDAYGCVLSCSAQTAASSMSDGIFDFTNGAVQARMYSPRDFTGLGSSVGQFMFPYTGSNTAMSGSDNTLGPFPSRVDGSLKLAKTCIQAGDNVTPRFDVPGLYRVPQSGVYDTIKHLDVVPGTGQLAGRNMRSLNSASTSPTTVPTSSNSGAQMVDVTGPWR